MIRDPNGSNRGSIVDFPPSRRRSDEPRTQYTQIDIGRTMRDAELQEDEMYIGMQNGVCGEYYSVMKPQLAEEEIYDSGVSGPAANGYPPAHLESVSLAADFGVSSSVIFIFVALTRSSGRKLLVIRFDLRRGVGCNAPGFFFI